MKPHIPVPSLAHEAWVLLSAAGVAALGTGLIAPFFIVYLTRIRWSVRVLGALVARSSSAISLPP